MLFIILECFGGGVMEELMITRTRDVGLMITETWNLETRGELYILVIWCCLLWRKYLPRFSPLLYFPASQSQRAFAKIYDTY